MAAKKDTKVKAAPRGSLQAATAKSKVAAAELIMEHEFADSPFSSEPKLHSDIRMFSVEITYCLELERNNPAMALIADAACTEHHTTTVTVIGNREINYPQFEPYPTHEERDGAKAGTYHVAIDETARYYGTLAANRLVQESGNRIKISAVTIGEQLIHPLLLDLTIE